MSTTMDPQYVLARTGGPPLLVSDADTWRRDAAWALRERRRLRPPAVVMIRLAEQPELTARLGDSGLHAALDEVAFRVWRELGPHDLLGRSEDGGLLVMLAATPVWRLRGRLDRIARRITYTPLTLGPLQPHITAVVGWAAAPTGPAGRDLDVLVRRANDAADVAAQHLDQVPRQWTPDRRPGPGPGRHPGVMTALQVLATLVIGLALPFFLLVELDRAGITLAGPLYVVVCLALVLTAAAIRLEAHYALAPQRPPNSPARPYPAASAIIPAYLPNEADTVLDTIRAVLAMDYPGPLQVVLAYNTPRPLPVEAELRALAAADPRFTPLRVAHSTSKAQNVNAALGVVTGEFTGVFDADHHPDPAAFRRAWRWLSHGADVVQGHCVVRNGAESWVARTVAVEFESIYAVSHPGRTRVHGFGLFGGSNGFWRTELLREIRMRGEMLTEDIDSSLRVLLQGRKVVTDPALLSRELAPATLRALWHQRMRWAQGWFQVSRKHLAAALSSTELTLRNKIGLIYLLGWREIYPWLSMQVYPILGCLAFTKGVDAVRWDISVFALAALYTLTVGPSQVLFAYRLAAPEIRAHKRWFWSYLVISTFFYTPLKNTVARVAQIKELAGERRWVITPRTTTAEAR